MEVKQGSTKELNSEVNLLNEQISELRAELSDVRDLKRRISLTNKKKSALESFYYEAIEEAAVSLDHCLAGNQNSSSLLDESENAVENLKRMVSLAVDTINDLRGSQNHPVKKIKKEIKKPTNHDSEPVEQGELDEVESIEDIEEDIKDLSPLGPIFASPERRESVEPLKTLDFHLEIETVSGHKAEGLIGGDWTYMAVKNHENYIIGTDEKGIKIIKNGSQIYCSKLPEEEEALRDLIYIEPMDSYLMDHDGKLYRKDIDEHPPHIFMDIKCGATFGACFRYSSINQRLIICKDGTKISVVNLENKKIEIQVTKSVGEDIMDFCIVGKEEDRVICVTLDGYLVLYKLNYSEKTGVVVSHRKVQMDELREESPQSIAICEKNQYLVLEIAGRMDDSRKCSRMMIFRVTEDKLLRQNIIDQSREKIREKLALECLGYVGTHILWLGLSLDEEGFAQIFDYT